VSVADDVTRQARSMTLVGLEAKVATAAADCGTLTARHASLLANPELYAAEIAAVARQRDNACAWSTAGAAELGRRLMQEATKKATAAAPRRRAPRKKEEEPAPSAPPPAAPPPAPPSTWPWIAGGAAALGLGVLAVLGLRRQPTVVRYVKGLPKKMQALPKKVTKAVRNR